jgi:hypothetical protein
MKITHSKEKRKCVPFKSLKNGSFYVLSEDDQNNNIYLKVNQDSFVWIGNSVHDGNGHVELACTYSHNNVFEVELSISYSIRG